MSDAELDDLDDLAKSTVDVLKQHAIDNGLPASYDIARIYSSEDDYIAKSYSVRKSYAPEKTKVTKKEQDTYGGEWDSWGLIPAHVKPVTARAQEQQNAWPAAKSNRVAEASPEQQSPIQVHQAKATEPSDEDGWGAWQPKTQQNDAFERRAALAGSSSTSSSTFTIARSESSSMMKETVDPLSKASHVPKASQLSPPPKVNGWIGSQNMDNLRLAQQDGWRDYEDKGPTILIPAREQNTTSSLPLTPQRRPATMVHVPTSSGLPEATTPDTSAHTTGWGPFDKYNPRTRYAHNDVHVPAISNGNLSPSDKRSGLGLDKEDAYPPLPGSANGVPFRQSEPNKSASGTSSWEDWKPSRHDDGEAAYRSRMYAKPASPLAARSLPFKQVSPSLDRTARIPEPIFSAAASEAPVAHPDVPKDASAPSEPPTEKQQAEDPWAGWTPSVAADKQGEQNFARRAEMSREYSMPERPMPSDTVPIQARMPSLAEVRTRLPRPDADVHTVPLASDDDAWANYKPKVSAQQQGNEAFERRRAMANASYTAHNTIPASESASSTSSTGSAFRARFGNQDSKKLSIAGRADRESSARAAKEARYKELQNGTSTLAKNFRSLKIAGSAARAASAQFPPAHQSNGIRSIVGHPPGGPKQMPHQQVAQKTASNAASSDSGTFISERPVALNGRYPVQSQDTSNGPYNDDHPQIPSGGIGWD